MVKMFLNIGQNPKRIFTVRMQERGFIPLNIQLFFVSKRLIINSSANVLKFTEFAMTV